MSNRCLPPFSFSTLHAFVLVTLLLVIAHCNPQYVVVVDTDAPVLSQTTVPRSGLSPDAALDMVRVDVLDENGQLIDVCEFAAPSLENWPLSFGITAPRPVRLRVRGFNSELQRSTSVTGFQHHCGEPNEPMAELSLSDPYPEATIDRVVALPPVSVASQTVHITLTLACMGAPPDFLSGTICIDASNRSSPISTAPFMDGGGGAGNSVAGTSPLALESDCDPALKPEGVDAVCIRGGFSMQGDVWLGRLGESAPSPPSPLRAVRISPYYLDRTEVTNGTYLNALIGDRSIGEPQREGTPALSFLGKYCTWNPNALELNKPVNCLTGAQARSVCRRLAGDLPSEAQWEHAARGRGRSWRFPWGARQPEACCKSSVGRKILREVLDKDGKPVLDKDGNPVVTVFSGLCPGIGPETVGSHQGLSCPEGGDVSIDGVLDLGGSVSEDCLDVWRPYAERCGLGVGVTADPICTREKDDEFAHVSRGGSWASGGGAVDSAYRNVTTGGVGSGFRCAYRGE